MVQLVDPFFEQIKLYEAPDRNARVQSELDWMLGTGNIEACSAFKAESLRQHMSSFLVPERRAQSRANWIDQVLQFAVDEWHAKHLAWARGIRIADAKRPCLYKFLGTGHVLTSRRYSPEAGCGVLAWDFSHTYPPGQTQRGFHWCQRCGEYPMNEERHQRFLSCLDEGFRLEHVEERSQLHLLVGTHLSMQDVSRFVGAQFNASRVRARINEKADRIYTEALSLMPRFDSLEGILREIL